MLDVYRETEIDKITFILLDQIIAQCDATYQGIAKLKQQLRDSIREQKKIKLLLPAFPCKTNNLDKVISHEPDMGEYLVLRRFLQCLRDIEAVYSPGVVLYIFSDYHTFSDYIAVDLSHHYAYSDGLKEMLVNMHAEDLIKIINFEDFKEFEHLCDTEYFSGLRNMFSEPGYAENFTELKLRNNKMNQTYLGLKKFMNQDQKYVLSTLSYKERRLRLAEIAKGMMIQGKALDNFLKQKFSDSIRLSIHEHPMNGKKYSLYLFAERQFKTPWHSTVLFDASQGKIMIDTKENHLKRAGIILPMFYKGKTWCYLQLTCVDQSMSHVVSQIRAELHHEKAGLRLISPTPSLSASVLNINELSQLVKEFGSVLLHGFAPFHHPDDFSTWYLQHRSAVIWGNDSVVEKLSGEVLQQSIGWQFATLSDAMANGTYRYDYEDITPHEYALYCACSETPVHMTTIDAGLAPLTLRGQEREQLRKSTLYPIKHHQDYAEQELPPLIRYCQVSRQDILRWQGHSCGQNSTIRLPQVDGRSSGELIEQRLDHLCTEPSLCFEHTLVAGDILFVNNLTTLQASYSLSPSNQCWRIQLQPPSINSPWQPHNRIMQKAVSEVV
ncbi:L-tyrosine/L-tryptophan isonitrile synthase family protein [Vibrio metschnikovii]|uniref:L-tyrosine/L-tryptophan isonitrile synthase family protein n=1 Tax=Vibrio metschnikovii TaxID=28172 RepID=UPI0029FBE8AE|nr:L-tyrosine/L-tryptophan isonitrile synthase family protein [Vibrio metschnikovii]EKO3718527.1 L-tyrosine/L-tryptophan isonitrile synthase family protein [Vibrio metschnikovii]EKO3791515.1 L-tyrosine/L-tryptophan isonitrile synthase family protein [Vibrio metschnikovii]